MFLYGRTPLNHGEGETPSPYAFCVSHLSSIGPLQLVDDADTIAALELLPTEGITTEAGLRIARL